MISNLKDNLETTTKISKISWKSYSMKNHTDFKDDLETNNVKQTKIKKISKTRIFVRSKLWPRWFSPIFGLFYAKKKTKCRRGCHGKHFIFWEITDFSRKSRIIFKGTKMKYFQIKLGHAVYACLGWHNIWGREKRQKSQLNETKTQFWTAKLRKS